MARFEHAHLQRYDDRMAWLSARSSLLTATAADMLILGKYGGIKKKKATKFYDTIYTKLGRAVEPVIIWEMARRYKFFPITVPDSIWVSTKYEGTGASLDGWTDDGIILEAKSNWNSDYWPDGEHIPAGYYYQVQFQLWTVGAHKAILGAVLCGRGTAMEFRAYEIAPDPDTHAIFESRYEKAVAAIRGKQIEDDPPAIEREPIVSVPRYICEDPEPIDIRQILDSEPELAEYCRLILRAKKQWRAAESLEPTAMEELKRIGRPVLAPDGENVYMFTVDEAEYPEYNVPFNVRNLYFAGMKAVSRINAEIIGPQIVDAEQLSPDDGVGGSDDRAPETAVGEESFHHVLPEEKEGDLFDGHDETN